MSGWQPSGPWKKAFREVLDDAFTDASLELLTADYFASDQRFSKVAPTGLGITFQTRLQQLIEEARMADWLTDLVAAAHERRPKHADLTQLATNLGLTSTGPRLDNFSGHPLEALIQEHAKFLTPSLFYERLPILEGQVCWVDVPGGGGTGFLIGPDLVLTNQHVIAPLTSGAASPQGTRCLFDYRVATDGGEVNRSQLPSVCLADTWLVASRPPSKFDWTPDLGDAAPSETDCALVRLAEPIGEDPVRGATGDPDAEPRGWVKIKKPPPPLAQGNQVFMLQHPKGEPLRLTVGAVTAFNAQGTRVRYDANSRDGSSGSPVFDADLELVALHHAHDLGQPPGWNQGVPLTAILKEWGGVLPSAPAGQNP